MRSIAVVTFAILLAPAAAQTSSGPPGHAEQVSVDGVTETSAVAHWTWVQGCDAGDVFLYAIPEQGPYQGRRADAPQDGSNPREARLDGLVPGTRYLLRIEPADTCGEGMVPPEPQATFKTLGTTPRSSTEVTHVDPYIGSGDDFRANPGRTSVDLAWDWSAGCTPTVDLEVYRAIDGHRDGDAPVATKRLAAATSGPQQTRVDGLDPGTVYWAIVVPTSNCGPGGGGVGPLTFTTEAERVGAGLGWASGLLAVALALALRRRI